MGEIQENFWKVSINDETGIFFQSVKDKIIIIIIIIIMN